MERREYIKNYMFKYRSGINSSRKSQKKTDKYGCSLCADKRDCREEDRCRYADILDGFDNYEEYDKLAQENVEALFERIHMEEK